MSLQQVVTVTVNQLARVHLLQVQMGEAKATFDVVDIARALQCQLQHACGGFFWCLRTAPAQGFDPR